MKSILFTLSMPNNNSWNGRWTGEGNLYCRIRRYPDKGETLKNVLSRKSHYYNFGDGWGASVLISTISGPEITKYKQASKGFCGYDWMIDEIEKHGRIIPLKERANEKEVANA